MKLGFPVQWIMVVASLYCEAFSSVLVADGQTRKFSISRSVCQGCPLGPIPIFATNGSILNVFKFLSSFSEGFTFAYNAKMQLHLGRKNKLR